MADLPNVNVEQIKEFKRLANTDEDTSVLMLNLNRYRPEAGCRFHKDDPYLLEISNGWGRALNVTFGTMPNLSLILVKDKIKEN